MSLHPSPLDTIAAVATPPGLGAVGIVRLSGRDAFGVLSGLVARNPVLDPHRLRPATLRAASGEILDQGLFVQMPGPRSYTGEDVVELHLHGSPVVLQAVLDRCLALGARLAEPGEFTLRAFVHGKLRLEQAEAVADIIASYNESSARAAERLLAGELARNLAHPLEVFEDVLSDVRAALDFPEYPTGDGLDAGHLVAVAAARDELADLRARARVDALRRRRVVLCGVPNAGKSSLLNALLGETRVLVHDTPGTTRDPVEVEVGRALVRWTLVDTAGLRADAVGLERAGIELTLRQAADADVVVWLLDPTAPTPPPRELRVDLVIGGKADLTDATQREGLGREHNVRAWVSARDGASAEALRAQLEALVDGSCAEGEGLWLRQRHVDALERALAALDRFAAGTGVPMDLRLRELEEAARAVGQILGRDVEADVLDQIFAAFCIGK